MVGYRQKIQRCFKLHFGPVIGVNGRLTFRKPVSGIGIGCTITKDIAVNGEIRVQVGVAPQQLIRILLRESKTARCKFCSEQ